MLVPCDRMIDQGSTAADKTTSGASCGNRMRPVMVFMGVTKMPSMAPDDAMKMLPVC